MATKALTKPSEMMPTFMDDFFNPWNQWFENGFFNSKTLTVPSVNIQENKDEFTLSLGVPGMKKEDFNIQVEGNLITISSEKEDMKEEKEAKFSRKEFNYSSFSRSFTLPDEVSMDKIKAHYEDGVLKLSLPKKEEMKNLAVSKNIAVN